MWRLYLPLIGFLIILLYFCIFSLFPSFKDEAFRFSRPTPSAQTSRQLKMDFGSVKSPIPYMSSASSSHAPSPKPQALPSPMRFESTLSASPFRFPDPTPPVTNPNPTQSHGLFGRRDSLFERPIEHSSLMNKLGKLGSERSVKISETAGGIGETNNGNHKQLTTLAMSSANLLASAGSEKVRDFVLAPK